MPGWTLIDTHPTQGRTFQRPLDVIETWFFWDGLFNGTADNLLHVEARLLNGSQEAHLFSEANIARAWVSMKRRYPLAGAIVRDADGGPLQIKPLQIKASSDLKAEEVGGNNGTGFTSAPHFVVREHDLVNLRPHEIVFRHVAHAEEVQQRTAAILDGPRSLSEELLMQLYIFRQTNSETTNILHLIILTAHCISDGIATGTFMRCLLDTLARGGAWSEPTQIPLEERLAMAISSMELEPNIRLRSLSPAIQRWRRVVGIVILQLKMAKRLGGHTLPCHLIRSTPHVPARSRVVSTSLTPAQTAVIVANCRLHNVSFGNAYLALAQVAMTRVLYRRYLRGEISEEEWAYRKRQPHIGGGPLNLRPYLDKAWFEKGGGGEFVLSVGFFFYQLPFMTLGTTAGGQQQSILSNGAPPFSDLLTFDRFLHRAGLVKKQVSSFLGHPLFFEIIRAMGLDIIQRVRPAALRWMQHVENGRDTQAGSDDNRILAVTEIPMVCACLGSSAGNLDLLSPTEFPLPPTHPLSPLSSVPHPVKAGYVTPPSPSPPAPEADMTPKIVVENTTMRLHTRPAELYISASSTRGRLSMYVYYDGNVFEEEVVREWLAEVREAVLWYLGQTHQSRRAQQRCNGSDTSSRTGCGEVVEAKL